MESSILRQYSDTQFINYIEATLKELNHFKSDFKDQWVSL